MLDQDYPLSSLVSGSRSAFGGVVSLYLGLVGGSLILLSVHGIALWHEWAVIPIAWFGFAAMAIIRLWGLLLLPLLSIMFYGLVAQEWNRWIGASVTALLFAAIGLLGMDSALEEIKDNWPPFVATLGVVILVLLLGCLWEWLQHHTDSSNPPSRSGKSPKQSAKSQNQSKNP